MLDDTEFLTWGENPKDALISGVATATTTSASMHWDVSQATGSHSAVFRKVANQPWTSIATVQADVNGDVSFVDNAVVAGANYSYELAVPSQRGEAVGGMVSVTIPGTLDVSPRGNASFALERMRPNPLVDRVNVSFVLPNAEPARIDVMDVNGRRLVTREVGSLGAGSHQVALGSARDFLPGIYFVRLSRGVQTLTVRAVVMGGGN